MARFARIFVIALVSAAGSCSSEQLSQKEVKRKEDIREQLATAYDFVYGPHSRRSYQQWSIAIWR